MNGRTHVEVSVRQEEFHRITFACSFRESTGLVVNEHETMESDTKPTIESTALRATTVSRTEFCVIIFLVSVMHGADAVYMAASITCPCDYCAGVSQDSTHVSDASRTRGNRDKLINGNYPFRKRGYAAKLLSDAMLSDTCTFNLVHLEDASLQGPR